jgi:hypothetical protein
VGHEGRVGEWPSGWAFLSGIALSCPCLSFPSANIRVKVPSSDRTFPGSFGAKTLGRRQILRTVGWGSPRPALALKLVQTALRGETYSKTGVRRSSKPLSLVGRGRRPVSPAFVGCISGLGTDGLERALSSLDVPIDLARTLNHLETGRELFARAWPR